MLNRNWPRTSKTKVHNYNTAAKPRRIGRLLFWYYNAYKKATGCKKDRNDPTQKPPSSTTSIRTSTTNPSTTSNSTNSIDNTSKSNPTIKATNTTNQNMPGTSDFDLDISPGRSLRIFNVMPRPEQPGAPYFDGTNVTEFLRR